MATPRDRAVSRVGWRRRALKLVSECVSAEVEQVLTTCLRKWPVPALAEATSDWRAGGVRPAGKLSNKLFAAALLSPA